MKHPRCYFAHHVTDYGTRREADAVALIHRAGFEVDNPNKPEHELGYRSYGMAYFLGRVAACDALAFQRFATGEIGAGVGKEIGQAIETGIPIYEVLPDTLILADGESITKHILTVEETRAMIQLLRNTH